MSLLKSTKHSRNVQDGLGQSRSLWNQQLFGEFTRDFLESLIIFIHKRAHKDILLFASPFFEAALSGKCVVIIRVLY
jgi:hypothetical protein